MTGTVLPTPDRVATGAPPTTARVAISNVNHGGSRSVPGLDRFTQCRLGSGFDDGAVQVGSGEPSDRLQRVPEGEHLQLDVAVVVAPEEIGALVAIDALEVGQDRAGEVLAVGVCALGGGRGVKGSGDHLVLPVGCWDWCATSVAWCPRTTRLESGHVLGRRGQPQMAARISVGEASDIVGLPGAGFWGAVGT